ncbi:hypothetical protein F4814DRAFT_434917, partial [Daldinia grandis]
MRFSAASLLRMCVAPPEVRTNFHRLPSGSVYCEVLRSREWALTKIPGPRTPSSYCTGYTCLLPAAYTIGRLP